MHRALVGARQAGDSSRYIGSLFVIELAREDWEARRRRWARPRCIGAVSPARVAYQEVRYRSLTVILMACGERSPRRNQEEGSVRLAETYGQQEETRMLKLYLWIRNLLTDEEGQTLTEYALILVLIAVVAIVAVTALGGGISNVLDDITNGLSPVGGS